ncbi:YitT family protein [Pediococcus inopinatus]|uniref:YitT family protein n=1 Tax=Pediococcus inopinatus TaxID=114090 RepID=UPI0007C5578D|nr:YitT family protein [Pediococcus inopinatus]WPC19008.1 YitT family protein [Pediococcus inopinatus]
MAKKESIQFKDLFMIFLGCCLYGLGLAAINIPNHLAEGGATGITLIFRALFRIDPAYSTILINIPLLAIGYRFLGKRALYYTIFGTLMLSMCLWIWQRVPINIDIGHDMFIAGILAGLAGGFGSGVVYRFGGTTGGTDVIARIIEQKRGVPMGQTLFALDAVVLTISLCYIDIRQMMYTLLAAFVFSRIVTFTQVGSYAARGILVISDNYQLIADELMEQLQRGASFVHVQGAYSKDKKKMFFCVLAPNELSEAKRIVDDLDPHAFISVVDVHEVIGEGFTYDSPTGKKIS